MVAVAAVSPVGAKKSLGSAFDDHGAFTKSLTPEIVIALCGPMGTPLQEVAKTFKDLISGTDFGYVEVKILRLSEEIRRIKGLQNEKSIEKLIDAGNDLRKEYGNAILAKLAIQDILISRAVHQEKHDSELRAKDPHAAEDSSALMPRAPRKCCHIIDSIKNTEELNLLRSVYGDMLHVVGVYSPIEMRVDRLSRRKGPEDEVHRLIDRDSGEEVKYGQSVEDTFPQCDFFLRVDSATDSQRNSRVRRFLELMLGTRIITPTINERAMYAAYSAARNSACLSRQVGAAITNSEGELLASGWNDVPKAFGGLYHTVDQNSSTDDDRRCWNIEGGRCFNDEEKTTIANAMVDRLIASGLVAEGQRSTAFDMLRKDSQLKSLIEFSRAVHAEMHALLTAGETKGGQIRNGKLFVTTYPCHSCARHLVAAGVKEVYFLEPYRKSLATRLHSDAITERESDDSKVRVMPFDGVAPSRFLRFFSAHPRGRKDPKGMMHVHDASPVTTITLEAIHTLEAFTLKALESAGLNKR
ncbi:anti-phage dCTP deaminase [Pseudomonas sp. 22-AL-CL-001]|uniref:anti-phage dCTP deaminase n=1 Tax=Pseudomonas alabamensis TaxID=3064349 RepID=UPI002713647E|nr:anti-phage dCTP deaminase [Pseudomonas sp. 22-AL-CL-001]MDO7910012.1 anti-phage dCTP deaminase [Pseudomonas sp. 22-AL-CL-001]